MDILSSRRWCRYVACYYTKIYLWDNTFYNRVSRELRLRYVLKLCQILTHYDACDVKFTTSHALACKIDGFTT